MQDAKASDVTRQLNNSHGSFELVLSPVILALLGWWIDARFDTGPWCTVTLAILGVVGATVKVVGEYRANMARETAVRPGAVGGSAGHEPRERAA
jgi:F0F1-type ATP synthase assembly protein I